MSHRAHTKSRIKVCSKSVFHLQDKNAEEAVLSKGLIKSAKRTGQLSLSNRGLGAVPDNVWKIDELVLDESKEVDFTRSDTNSWWNSEPLKMLDLSSNAIATLSSDIKLLQELVTLKLHDNALSELPDNIGELKNLANLSLDYNKLVTLPKGFYKLSELRMLSISHNQLEKIEPDFGDFVMLTFLDLSHNQISVLPPGMGYLVRLLELNLSSNRLEELPPDIVNLRELKKLNISHNQLSRLPALGELRRMEVLEGGHNRLLELPHLGGCGALRELYLQGNCVQEITEEFCEQAQQLLVLSLRDNQVQVLPENVSLLQKLKRLDLTNNNLNKLPRNLGLLTQLQSIHMEGNKLAFVRQDVVRGGAQRMMKFLRDRLSEDVVAETRRTEDDWPDTYTLKKSQALVVAGRQLRELPERVLQEAAAAGAYLVDASDNRLPRVPSGVWLVRETLTQLVLAANCLESVPPELARCERLQFLDLAKNRLADLPPELGQLRRLRELLISNNRFPRIPECVYQLGELEILLAADNQIEEIDASPLALGRLQRLAVLDLANNSIRAVPPDLGLFTHLRSLELMGNCFRQPRHAVLARGTPALLAYLRDRRPQGSDEAP